MAESKNPDPQSEPTTMTDAEKIIDYHAANFVHGKLHHNGRCICYGAGFRKAEELAALRLRADTDQKERDAKND
jgi:hypothetical protein